MKTKKVEKRQETISVKVTKSVKEAGRIKAAKDGKTLSSKMAELLYDYISRYGVRLPCGWQIKCNDSGSA